MRTLLLSTVFLLGCNAEPGSVTTSATAVTTVDEPVDCVAQCEHARPQLVRDFGVNPAAIDCPHQFSEASTCRTCNERFAALYGVQLLSCP